MNNRTPSLYQALLCSLFLCSFVALLCAPDVSSAGATRGLSLCTTTLLPSLFPFLVLSELMVTLRAGDLFGRLVTRPVMALFGLSEQGAVTFLLGSVCGFPVGAATAVSYREGDEITQGELDRLLLFCNNPSPGFLVSAAGEALFGSRDAGIALLVITLLSACIVGVGLRIFFGAVPKIERRAADGVRNPPLITAFTGSVRRAFAALLPICAFVIFFSCVAGCLTPALDALDAPPILRVLLQGALELTGGVELASRTLPPAYAFCLVAFFASFSGLSACLQVFSCAERCGARLGAYLLAKLTQGAIALLLSVLYVQMFSPALVHSQSAPALARPDPWHLIATLTLLCALAIPLATRNKKASP